MRGLKDTGKQIKNITAEVLLNLKECIDQIAPSLPSTSMTTVFAMPPGLLHGRDPKDKREERG